MPTPGELENLGHPDHPHHDPALVAHMLSKLHALVAREIGDDERPFDLNLFGTAEVKYRDALAADERAMDLVVNSLTGAFTLSSWRR
jgi:hypothetical protein